MSSQNVPNHKPTINRRQFLQATAITGAGLILAPSGFAADEEAKPVKKKPEPDPLNVAIIGPGSQGMVLLDNSLNIPGIRYKAVCDIWEYGRAYSSGRLKKHGQKVNVYIDYRDLLDKEKDLDAVIIATPDWMHAEQTIACLKAGLHVYCEKEMSNDLEKCRQMVLAARKSGKLLQIGHQRRSNPRYHLADKLIHHDKVLGRITHFNGQWNRAKRYERGWPKKKYLMTKATLEKYGYDTMEKLRNWRWYHKFSGGAMADLGSHQVDIFSWFLRANPVSVIGSGGLDYYKDREWYDNVMAIYEYKTKKGLVRGFYQVLNTTSHGGFYETFMGDEGSLVISEDTRKGFLFREKTAKPREWEDVASKVIQMDRKAIELKVGESRKAEDEKDPEKIEQAKKTAKKPVHQFHLENFFDAIRNGTPLTCPAQVGYETAVAVLRVNESIKTGKKIEFKPEDFLAEKPKKKPEKEKHEERKTEGSGE